MESKKWIKKMLCIFMSAVGICLFGNLKTNAASLEETVCGMNKLVRVLDEFTYSDVAVKKLTCDIKRAVKYLEEIKTPLRSGFRCLDKEKFLFVYKVIKAYEHLMKLIGQVGPDEQGVKILFRGVYFQTVEKATEYLERLIHDGIATSFDPRAKGARCFGPGIYFSDQMIIAYDFTMWGDIRYPKQLILAMAFDDVKPVCPGDYEFCISSQEKADEMILCSCMLGFDDHKEKTLDELVCCTDRLESLSAIKTRLSFSDSFVKSLKASYESSVLPKRRQSEFYSGYGGGYNRSYADSFGKSMRHLPFFDGGSVFF